MARRRRATLLTSKKRSRGGRLFDDLLVPSLHAAFALAEDDCAACPVAEPLHLDVLGRAQVALEVDARIAEGRTRAIGASLQRALELVGGLDDLHPDSAAARDRFDDDRIADSIGVSAGQLECAGVVARAKARRARAPEETPAALATCRAFILSPSASKHFGRRPDEHHARVGVPRARTSFSRSETVSRMNRLGAGLLAPPRRSHRSAGSSP